jgi:hypothetical protein
MHFKKNYQGKGRRVRERKEGQRKEGGSEKGRRVRRKEGEKGLNN